MKRAPYILSLIISSSYMADFTTAHSEDQSMGGSPQVMDETLQDGRDAVRSQGAQQRNRASEGLKDSKRAAEPSAQNQSSRAESLQITQKIRKQIMEQSQLSTAAKNVKVITDDNGSVTLRGPVKTPAERQQVEQIARNNAQGGQVNNQIVVKSDEKGKGEAHG